MSRRSPFRVLHFYSSPVPVPEDFVPEFLNPGLRRQHRRELRRLDGRCAYCGRVCPEKKATLDHIIPFGRGGANTVGNLALACDRCNYAKENLTAEEYLRRLIDAARRLRAKLRRPRVFC